MSVAVGDVTYDQSPSVAVFADTAEGLTECEALVRGLGARVGPAGSIVEAVAALDALARVDAVLVDLRGKDGEAFDRLLDRLDQAARADGYASVVAFSPEVIDAAAARAAHARVHLLVGTSRSARAAALGLALARAHVAEPHLAEREGEPMHLMQLSEEVSRIARALATLSGEDRTRGPRPMAVAAPVDPPTAATVRAAIRTRRLREQFFDAELFADPAWDMLLDLMAARLEGRHVAVSSLCIAAAVPPTTALRWMKQLTDEGVFVRVADPRDGRRVFIELSNEAAAGMAAYFQAVGRVGFVLR